MEGEGGNLGKESYAGGTAEVGSPSAKQKYVIPRTFKDLDGESCVQCLEPLSDSSQVVETEAHSYISFDLLGTIYLCGMR
jgi:hypothetical protein